jgi:hypothetical protein
MAWIAVFLGVMSVLADRFTSDYLTTRDFSSAYGEHRAPCSTRPWSGQHAGGWRSCFTAETPRPVRLACVLLAWLAGGPT